MQVMCLPVGELDTNCYLVWEDKLREALVLDPGADAPAILRVAEREGLTVQAVVLTHVHFDHMLAAEAVCRACRAPLWVGAGDADALSDSRRNLSSFFRPATPVTVEADRLLHEGDVLTVGDDTLTVWETPGHTPGSLSLIGEKVVFSGDTLFAGSAGRVDFPGGDRRALARSLRRLAALPSRLTVYAGHGPFTTIAQELLVNPYFR